MTKEKTHSRRKAVWLVFSTIPSLPVLCMCVAVKNTSTRSHSTQNILGATCKCVHYCLSLNETKTLQKGSLFSHNTQCITVGFTCSHDTLSHIPLLCTRVRPKPCHTPWWRYAGKQWNAQYPPFSSTATFGDKNALQPRQQRTKKWPAIFNFSCKITLLLPIILTGSSLYIYNYIRERGGERE